ncbi:MAG: translocation/assembly module TamB domain-containing protein [bacterium]
MTRRAKTLIWIGAIALVIGVGTPLAFKLESERIAAATARLITARIGGDRHIKIEAADLGGSVFHSLRVKDLRITYYGGGDPRVLLAAPSAYVEYDLMSLFQGTVTIDSVSVESPRLVVPTDSLGRRIYPLGDPVPGPKTEGRDLDLRAIAVSDLSVVWEAGKPWIVKGVAVGGSYSKTGGTSHARLQAVGLDYGEAGCVESLSVDLKASGGRVDLADVAVRTPGSSFGLAGWFGTGDNDSMAAELRLDSLSVAEAPALLGRARAAEAGVLRGRLAASGRYTHLGFDADLAGNVGQWRMDGLAVRGLYADRTLAIDSLDCLLNGNPVRLAGDVTFSKVPEYQATVDFRGLDLASFSGGHAGDLSSDLSGRVRLVGRGLDRPTLSATAWPDLSGGRYRQWVFDSVAGEVTITGNKVQLDTVFARIGRTSVRAEGVVGYAGDVDLGFSVDCPRLEDLVAYHRTAGLTGEARADARFQGGPGNLRFQAKSLGRGIDYSGAYMESLLVDLDLSRAGRRWEGRGGLVGSTMNLRGFKAGRLLGDVVMEDSTIVIRQLAVTRPEGNLMGASGRIELTRKGFVAGIDDLFIEMADQTWRNKDPIEVSYLGDSVGVSRFVMASDMGTLSVSNSSFAKERFRLDARVESLDLALLKKALGKDIPTGMLDLRFEAGGSGDDLAFDLSFGVKNGDVGGVVFSYVEGTVGYRDKTLSLERVSLLQNGGSVVVAGTVPVDLTPTGLSEASKAGRFDRILEDLGEVSIVATGMDVSVFRSLAPPLARVRGTADLDLTLGGRKDNPRIASRGTLHGAVYGEAAIGEVGWDVVLQDSVLRVAGLDVSRGEERISVTGEIPVALSMLPFSSGFPRRPMDLSVSATNGDLGLLCEMIPSLKECSGTYDANLRIGGTLDDPTFEGQGSLADGRLRFEGVAQDFAGIGLEFNALGKRFEITRIVAEQEAVKARGTLDLDGVKLKDYNFEVSMKDLVISEFEDFYVAIGGDVIVKAEPVEFVGIVPSIEGNVVIDKGEYYYSPEAIGGGGGGMGPQAAPTWLMNVGVEIPNDFWIRGDEIDAELGGSLNVRMGADGLLVLGMLRTIRGTFYIYHNDFKITRGEFRFTDVKSIMNVYIDLEATSRVLDERVYITAKGNMKNLDVAATSETGWSETQIFEALTLRRGAETEDQTQRKFFTDEFLRSWGVALVNRFGNDVARDLRLDEFGVEVGDVGEGNVLSATRVTFGKYVSDRVYLQYTQSLGSLYGGSGKLTQQGLANPERRLQAEYRLSDKFSMEGEAGTVGGLGYFDVDLTFKLGY